MSFDGYYQGQLLIATPSLQGSCFTRSVLFMCNHDEEGAMGLIINHALSGVDANKILSQFDITVAPEDKTLPVHFGGPVDMVRGFVLHTPDYHSDETLPIDNFISLTSNISILKNIAAGEGPEKSILALGYAGWSPGQLEGEVERNSWFTVPASETLVFDIPNEFKWETAAESVGVDLLKFSGQAGHA